MCPSIDHDNCPFGSAWATAHSCRLHAVVGHARHIRACESINSPLVRSPLGPVAFWSLSHGRSNKRGAWRKNNIKQRGWPCCTPLTGCDFLEHPIGPPPPISPPRSLPPGLCQWTTVFAEKKNDPQQCSDFSTPRKALLAPHLACLRLQFD